MNKSGCDEYSGAKMLAKEEYFGRDVQRLHLLGRNGKSTAKETGRKDNDYVDGKQAFGDGAMVDILQMAAACKGRSYSVSSVPPPHCGFAMASAADILVVFQRKCRRPRR